MQIEAAKLCAQSTPACQSGGCASKATTYKGQPESLPACPALAGCHSATYTHMCQMSPDQPTDSHQARSDAQGTRAADKEGLPAARACRARPNEGPALGSGRRPTARHAQCAAATTCSPDNQKQRRQRRVGTPVGSWAAAAEGQCCSALVLGQLARLQQQSSSSSSSSSEQFGRQSTEFSEQRS